MQSVVVLAKEITPVSHILGAFGRAHHSRTLSTLALRTTKITSSYTIWRLKFIA